MTLLTMLKARVPITKNTSTTFVVPWPVRKDVVVVRDDVVAMTGDVIMLFLPGKYGPWQ